MTWEYADFTLKNMYPKIYENTYEENCEQKMIDFK